VLIFAQPIKPMTEENKEEDLILVDSDFELTSEPEYTKPRDINMSDLIQLADELDALEAKISETEVELSVLKQARKTIAEDSLPTLMEQAGVDTLKLTNGRKIEIKDFVDARITDPAVAFNWLRDTNNESIIKNEISVSLGRGDDAIAQDIIETLKQQYEVDAAVKVGIHNMTLKAFCRDALDNPELAETLPKKAFGIYQGKRAKIN
jgi:hypothetical protein